MYFKRLNFKLPEVDISKLKGKYGEGYGPTFKLYNIKDINYLDNLFASRVKFHIPPVVKSFVEISDGGTGAHIDHHSVALNYYLDPGSGLTFFWTPKQNVENKVVKRILEDGSTEENTVRGWEFEDLNFVTSFKPESNDAVLLNVKQIHSVAKFNQSSMRSLISLRWFFEDFETVLNSIEILDNK